MQLYQHVAIQPRLAGRAQAVGHGQRLARPHKMGEERRRGQRRQQSPDGHQRQRLARRGRGCGQLIAQQFYVLAKTGGRPSAVDGPLYCLFNRRQAVKGIDAHRPVEVVGPHGQLIDQRRPGQIGLQCGGNGRETGDEQQAIALAGQDETLAAIEPARPDGGVV